MILLFNDFGLEGPYPGQIKAVLARLAPGTPVIDLFADVPPFRVKEAAYLLAAYRQGFEAGSVFLCVVDPGVGGARPAMAACIDGTWFVGPGNGLFEIVARRGRDVRCFSLPDPEGPVSASFHGRDLFAPAAARLALSRLVGFTPAQMPRFPDWPDDLPGIVYADRYGNLMTGLRARSLGDGARLGLNGRILTRARTFSDRAPGEAFWYENSNGLAEIAVNQGSAAAMLHAGVGMEVAIM